MIGAGCPGCGAPGQFEAGCDSCLAAMPADLPGVLDWRGRLHESHVQRDPSYRLRLLAKVREFLAGTDTPAP